MPEDDYKFEGFSIQSIGGREPLDSIPFGWVKVHIHLTQKSMGVHPSVELAVAIPYVDADTVVEIEGRTVEETSKMLRAALAVIESTPLAELKKRRL